MCILKTFLILLNIFIYTNLNITNQRGIILYLYPNTTIWNKAW